jgi:hypothetical protein
MASEKILDKEGLTKPLMGKEGRPDLALRQYRATEKE